MASQLAHPQYRRLTFAGGLRICPCQITVLIQPGICEKSFNLRSKAVIRGDNQRRFGAGKPVDFRKQTIQFRKIGQAQLPHSLLPGLQGKTLIIRCNETPAKMLDFIHPVKKDAH